MKKENLHKKLILSFSLFVALLLINCTQSIGQNNLIPNPSFEDANTGKTPACQYGTGNSTADVFDDDIVWWKVARHNNDKGFGVPEWVDINNASCMSSYVSFVCPVHIPFYFPSNRFITLQSQWWNNNATKPKFKHEAIRVSLIVQPLEAGATYVIRMKVIPMISKTNNLVLGNKSHLRVFFTKWSVHWNSNSNNNQKFEATNANILLPHNTDCSWQFIERRFTVPSNKTELKNLVLYAEDNRFAIDDVELFKECPSNILIQNQLYHSSIYNSAANQGSPFSEKASDFVIAGNNVGNPQVATGDVIVRNGSQVTYTAGQKIILQPGFRAETGSIFKAIIAPCPNSFRIESPELADTTDMEKENSFTDENSPIYISPNPTTGKFTIQIADEDEFPNINYHLEIHNTLGQVVFKSLILNPNSLIDFSAHSKGIYFIKLISEGNIYTEKIIIQ